MQMEQEKSEGRTEVKIGNKGEEAWKNQERIPKGGWQNNLGQVASFFPWRVVENLLALALVCSSDDGCSCWIPEPWRPWPQQSIPGFIRGPWV